MTERGNKELCSTDNSFDIVLSEGVDIRDPNTFQFREAGKELFRIVLTGNGFDVVLSEGVEMTDAAKLFITTVRDLTDGKMAIEDDTE